MYTDDAVSTGGDDDPSSTSSRRPAPTTRIPCTRRCTTRCPGRARGRHVRRPQRDAVALRRRAVGAEAPRGVLVEGRRQDRQRRSAHPAVGRPARAREVPAPARPAVLAEAHGRARARGAHARQRDHRRVRRRAASATSTRTSPRRCRRRSSSRSWACRRRTCPQFLRWRDDTIRPQADETGDRRREARGRGQGDRELLRDARSRRSARTPTTGC